MIEEQALVLAVENGSAWVQTRRETSCGGCSASKGCGTSALSQVMGKKRSQIRVIDPLGTKPGDLVVLGLEESAMVQGAALLYLVPLLALFVSAGFVQWLMPTAGEPIVILAGILGLAAGLLALKTFLKEKSADRRYQPVILRQIVTVRVAGDSVFPA